MRTFIAATVIALSATVSMNAQEPRAAEVQAVVPCPHAISTTINGSNPPAPVAADFGALYSAVQGSQWNQTTADKKFGTSFHIPHPGRECCIWTSATVTLTIKALQGGAFNTPSSGNDGINIFSNGASVAATTPWPNGATTGQVRTLTISVPPSALLHNTFGLYVQDDTAVLSAVVRLQGCCIR